MDYKIGEWYRAEKDFRDAFGCHIKNFLEDRMLMSLTHHICINIGKFDDYLHEIHGEYEDEGKSMRDVVFENYGQEAVRVIENLM